MLLNSAPNNEFANNEIFFLHISWWGVAGEVKGIMNETQLPDYHLPK